MVLLVCEVDERRLCFGGLARSWDGVEGNLVYFIFKFFLQLSKHFGVCTLSFLPKAGFKLLNLSLVDANLVNEVLSCHVGVLLVGGKGN